MVRLSAGGGRTFVVPIDFKEEIVSEAMPSRRAVLAGGVTGGAALAAAGYAAPSYATDGDARAAKRRVRLTVLGTFGAIAREESDEPRLRARFLLRHPKSELYAGFGDFAFWRMRVVSAHLNGGFARAADLTAADLLSDLSDAGALVEAEEGAIAHMNDDHAEACRLYATRLLKAPEGPWRCVGIAPEGLELQHSGTALWLPFPQRVTGPVELRGVLKQLADIARATPT